MSGQAGAVLYLARMDVEPDFLERFEDWYARKHAVDLIASGFRSCAAYHAVVGRPLVNNLYEIDDVGVFDSERYRTARTEAEDPERPLVLSHVSSRSNVPYRQELVLDPPSGDGDLHQPWLAMLQYDVAEGADESDVHAWARAMAAALVGLGASAVRLCRREGVHPANPSTDVPGLMLLAVFPAGPGGRDDASALDEGEVGRLREEARGGGPLVGEVPLVLARRRHAVRAA